MRSLFTENGRPSGTKALLSLAGLVVIVRLALAGVKFGEAVPFPPLEWSGVAVVLGALAALYAGRRATDAWKETRGGPNG